MDTATGGQVAQGCTVTLVGCAWSPPLQSQAFSLDQHLPDLCYLHTTFTIFATSYIPSELLFM